MVTPAPSDHGEEAPPEVEEEPVVVERVPTPEPVVEREPTPEPEPEPELLQVADVPVQRTATPSPVPSPVIISIASTKPPCVRYAHHCLTNKQLINANI